MVSCTYLGAASVVLSDLQKFAIEENFACECVAPARALCRLCKVGSWLASCRRISSKTATSLLFMYMFMYRLDKDLT